MPKYTVEEVVGIIQSLTADEKRLLQAQLPAILDSIPSTNPASNVQTRSMSIGGNFTVSGTGVSVDMSQTQAGSDVSFSKSTTGTTGQPWQAILQEMMHLEQEVLHSAILTASERAATQEHLRTLITELQKPEPDKSFVQQAIAALKGGLEGVLTLATPVIKVAELVATAWLI